MEDWLQYWSEEKTNKILFSKLIKDINYKIEGKILKFNKSGIIVKTNLLFEGLVSKKDFDAIWSSKENRWINEKNWKPGDKLKLKICKKYTSEKIQLSIL